jgi:hypothetical protein
MSAHLHYCIFTIVLSQLRSSLLEQHKQMRHLDIYCISTWFRSMGLSKRRDPGCWADHCHRSAALVRGQHDVVVFVLGDLLIS